MPTGMWHIDAPLQPHLINCIGTPTTADLVAFAHATLFSPALSALEQALTRGYITNFPGLTAATLRRHPPTSIPMVKGHIDQTRKNQRSTKPTPVLIVPDNNYSCSDEAGEFYPVGLTKKRTNASSRSWSLWAKSIPTKPADLSCHPATVTTIC
jgi:hypothetical protein